MLEAPGQHPARRARHWPQRCRHQHGRVGQYHRGEGDVVGPRAEQGRAPVKHGGRSARVGQQVERVQVAVADHLGRGGRRVGGQPPADTGEIFPVVGFRQRPQVFEQAGHGRGDGQASVQLAAQRPGVETVEFAHRDGQRLRDGGGQAGQLCERPGAVEAGEQRSAGGPVHHHEGAPEPIAGPAGGPDLRRREATARHLGLNERFFAGQCGVGHHPGDEVAVKARRSAGEAEGQQLRPETPCQRLGWRGKVETRVASGRAQHRQQALGELISHSYSIYRNGFYR